MAIPQPGVWGIDLGQCALKAIRLEEVGGEIKATAFDYIEHPKILSQPDADPDQLTREALEQFLSRNKLQKGDTVAISVPGQTGLARFVKLPPVEEKKIADIVKFEAKQQIPFPLEEVVWDFQKIGSGEVTDGFALETEIGLFAMKRDMVNRAIQQFRDVKVEVHIVQMAPLSLCNLVAYEKLGKGAPGTEGEAEGEEGSCIVALEIGTDNSNLIITDGGKIIWQRPIPLGGNHFTRALTKDLKLTFAKAEHLKRNAIKSPDLKKILASLKTVLNDFVGEVQRSLGYFTNTHRNAKIQYMLGLGNAFRLPGLQKYLQEKLQLEVRKLGKLERVTGEEVLTAPQFSENILTFGVAIGLALQGLNKARIHTNLLPPEIKTERIVRAKKPWAAAAAACLVLAIAGITAASNMEFKRVSNPALKKRIEEANKFITDATGLNNELKAEEDRIKASDEAINRIGAGVKQRFNWRLLYRYINLALPRVDGSNLVERNAEGGLVYSQYVGENSKKALDLLDERRYGDPIKAMAGEKLDKIAKKLQADEEFIKANLIQINIEGVIAVYSEDVAGAFNLLPIPEPKNTFEFRGMSPAEKGIVQQFVAKEPKKRDDLEEKDRGLVPEKAWIVEIRGYTYHQGRTNFVQDTILENLKRPKDMKMILDKKEVPDDLEKIQDLVQKNVRFMFIYTKDFPKAKKGVFEMIGTSGLKDLVAGTGKGGGGGIAPGPMGGGGMPAPMGGGDGSGDKPAGPAVADRSGWSPFGAIAKQVLTGGGFGGGAGGVGFDAGKGGAVAGTEGFNRTEFVAYFIWDEPILLETGTKAPE